MRCKIGIGVTTKDRRELASKSIGEIIRLAPAGAKIVIIDDGSAVPYPTTDGVTIIRHEAAKGINWAKNAAIHALDDCDHVFLFDDDCYPIVKDWYQPYITSGVNHLCHSWSKRDNGRPLQGVEASPLTLDGKDFMVYSRPCGCMIYLTARAIRNVGGMTVNYCHWSYEHVGLSHRIHNAGLTPYPFMDIADSNKLFFAYDRLNASSTSSVQNKQECLKHNFPIYRQERRMKYWKPTGPVNVVLSCFLTSIPDPQRSEMMKPDYMSIVKWVESVTDFGYTAVLLTNEFETEAWNNFKVIKCRVPCENPYWARWKLFDGWISEHSWAIRDLWITDATDVEMINAPKPEPGKLYVGDEAGQTVTNPWIRQTARHVDGYLKWALENPKLPLFNCGVLGGNVDKVARLVAAMANAPQTSRIDMAYFNMLTHHMDVEYGRHVTTPFKQFVRTDAWFKHK